MLVFDQMTERRSLVRWLGGRLAVAPVALATTGCLGLVLSVGALAAQEVDPEVFVRSDAGRDAIEHGLENMISIMASDETDLVELVRRVLAEGTEETRERFFGALSLFNSLLGGIPPEMSELMAADVSGGVRQLRNMFGETASRTELARMGRAYARNVRSLQEQIPAIVEGEFRRQQEAGATAHDTSVFGFLFGIAQYFEQLGSVEARDAAFAAWMEVEGAEELFFEEFTDIDRERVKAMPAGLATVGRGVPLWFLLMQVPQDEHPLVGRRLDPRLRQVARELLRQGTPELRPEELREMRRQAGGMVGLHEDAWSTMTASGAAWLLAAERPLADGSAAAAYEFGCGAVNRGCAVLAAVLYSGPDDPSLASIQPRLEDSIAQWLAGARSVRRELCEKRTSADGAVVARLAEEDTVKRGREELDRQTQTETETIEAVLDLAELVDRPSPLLLDAVFEYWAEERDPKAQEILVRRGMLEASALSDSTALPALGDCLAEEAGPSVLH